VLQLAVRSVLAEFAADGVRYLELRTTPRALTPPRGPVTSAEDSLRLVVSELNAWNAANGGLMPVRLIVAVDRAKHDVNAAEWIVDLALGLRNEGAPIVALDLCGDPNKLIDVATLRAPFLRARRNGLPCVLHFAEVPASSHTAELEELLSWRPRRLGHAIHVPAAMRERILALGAAPELCLSCNILAGMLPPRFEENAHTKTHDCRPASFVDHHFGWWWAAGGPLSLGTDDVGVFGSPSSKEHHHAAQHFQLSRRSLVDLSRRAMGGALGGMTDELRMDRILDQFVRQEGIEVEEVAHAFSGTEML
jgi:adenosine deaminase